MIVECISQGLVRKVDPLGNICICGWICHPYIQKFILMQLCRLVKQSP